MKIQDLLKNFVESSKQLQQNHDTDKISELTEQLQSLKQEHKLLQSRHEQIKEQLQEQIVQLKMANIKLDSQNKVIKMRNDMLEDIVKQSQQTQTAVGSPIDAPAYQILKQENEQLKALMRQQLAKQ